MKAPNKNLTSKEALDALVEELPCECNDGTRRTQPCKFCRIEATIEALRRERDNLEAQIEKVNGWSVSGWAAGRRKAVEKAKTVTREQIREATDNTNMSGYKDTPSYSAMLEFCHHLGLTIIDSEPGRECDCTEDYTETLGLHYWCPHRQESVSRRCTIKDGESE